MNTTMTLRRQAWLPHEATGMALTDGGLETTLVFHENWELPEFAAFPLLDSSSGRETLRRYYERYIGIALASKVGFVLESPTWRASQRWGSRVGYIPDEIADINRRAIRMLQELRDEFANAATPMAISGCIGPQDDGYSPSERLSEAAAFAYHTHQAQALAAAGADMITAVTMTYVEEAIGITRCAQAQGIPVVISFTVETDGRLPVGTPLGEAIEAVDAATDHGPAYYMINCAHPTHFATTLREGGDWVRRIGGLRANASRMSHEELDAAETLDDGDPKEFGCQHDELRTLLPNLKVLGGCCGTDHRHVEAMAASCL